ncbi:MAG: hypothetical protein HYT76_05735 [Deltaproteobacteria bacterium]|nr:hypothetical protein [Deltaproteobacteria bacterium]
MKSKFEFIDLDKRVLERRLQRHELSQADYQKILKGLSNEEEYAEELQMPEEESKIPEDITS